jgi:tetratricopeptide (TPR) repeat protein
MKTRVAIILLTALALGAVQSAVGAEDQVVAPLLEGMGKHHHPITTEDPMVQRYFDQGLVLAYGFNHAEAARSFREAIRRDPECASCYWGLSYVLGPNINSMMNAEDLPEAWKALQKAIALVDDASEQEQAYIRALQTRYTEDLPDDRSHLDVAYADAMRKVARRYPKDTDAGTLLAEALMDTTPWDYWREDGKPKPETVEIMETLETVMDSDPNHPGANHLYIHIVEAQRATRIIRVPITSTSTSSRPSGPRWGSRRPTGWESWSPAPGIWCTCHRTSTSGWAAITMLRSPTRKPSRPTTTTSPPVANRVSTR